MPIVVSNESMFPPFPFSYKDYADDCMKSYGVRPRQHWITTEFGGTVSIQKDYIFVQSIFICLMANSLTEHPTNSQEVWQQHHVF